MNKMNKKGFTLIEMLVVIAIIAVLVAIIVPTVSKATNKAKAAADAANLRSFAAQVAVDYLDDNTVTGPYKLPAAKTTGAGDCEVHLVNGEFQAFFLDANGKGMGVAYFSNIAETGDVDENKLVTLDGNNKVTVPEAA